MTSKQILNELDGCEIRVFNAGIETDWGVVGVEAGKVTEAGKVFKLTVKQVKALWEDYLYQEGITNSSGEVSEEVLNEFQSYRI